MISINSNDSCDEFEFNYIKKKIKKTKLKKVFAMTTKKGIKLYINGIQKRNNRVLKNETLYMKEYKRDLKKLKKRKSLNSSEKLRIKYLSEEIKKSMAKITDIKKYKKGLTSKMVESNLKKLRKHPNIIGVEAGINGFQIYTKPLKIKKQKIGHYEIEFSHRSPEAIHIFNLYKKRIYDDYDHWFIRRGKPCLGKWKTGLKEYIYSGNIYLVVDTFIRFLTSKYHSKEGYITFKRFTTNY